MMDGEFTKWILPPLDDESQGDILLRGILIIEGDGDTHRSSITDGWKAGLFPRAPQG